jgi:hypothetical protein
MKLTTKRIIRYARYNRVGTDRGTAERKHQADVLRRWRETRGRRFAASTWQMA